MVTKGIFFDLYGTLLIYEDMGRAWSDWLAALHANLIRFGFAIDLSYLAEGCDGFFSRPEPTWVDDGLTVYERRLQALFESLDIAASPKQLSEAATQSVQAWQEQVSLDPEAIPLLTILQETYSLALVSNFDHPPHVQSILQTTGLAPFFEVVIISGIIGVKKPDPRIFDPALGHFDLRPEEVAYVGDSPEDIIGATAASMTPVIIRRGVSRETGQSVDFRVATRCEESSHQEADHFVSSLDEIPELEILKAFD